MRAWRHMLRRTPTNANERQRTPTNGIIDPLIILHPHLSRYVMYHTLRSTFTQIGYLQMVIQ